jgi:hypothetical protein
MSTSVIQCAWCRRLRTDDGTFAQTQAGLLIGANHTICSDCDHQVRVSAQARLDELALTA